MRFQFISDPHLDFSENVPVFESIIPSADILLVAGDVSNCYSSKRRKQFAENFYNGKWKQVIEIPGNHHFYKMNVEQAHFNGIKEIETSKNTIVTYINNHCIHFNDVVIVGSTLWSNVPYSKVSLFNSFSDHAWIGGMSIDVYNCLHQKSLDFIRDSLNEHFDKKCIVMTHHVPLIQLTSSKFIGNEFNDMFVNNLDMFIPQFNNVKYWLHGHSHDFVDTTISGVRHIRNPLGYVKYREDLNFKKDFVIEI